MKPTLKSLTVLFLISILGFSASAQTIREFYNSSELPLTYLGVDYTKAKLINDPDANTFDIKDRLYGSINSLIVQEFPKHYDIKGAFQKSNVYTDITAVNAHNAKINADDIKSVNSADFARLNESDIASVIRGLPVTGKTGIGLVFVMEGMKKEGKKSYGSVWVTLIDMKSKKVLMAERMEAEAGGIGFRNYWASVIKKVLVTIEKKKYKEWKAQYGG